MLQCQRSLDAVLARRLPACYAFWRPDRKARSARCLISTEGIDLSLATPVRTRNRSSNDVARLRCRPRHPRGGWPYAANARLQLRQGADGGVAASGGSPPARCRDAAGRNGQHGPCARPRSPATPTLSLDRGSFIDHQSPVLGNTPVMDAVLHKQGEADRSLLERGARTTIRNPTGHDFATPHSMEIAPC